MSNATAEAAPTTAAEWIKQNQDEVLKNINTPTIYPLPGIKRTGLQGCRCTPIREMVINETRDGICSRVVPLRIAVLHGAVRCGCGAGTKLTNILADLSEDQEGRVAQAG